MISDRLINRLPKERGFDGGISGKDLESLSLTDDLKADIISAMSSDDPTDIRYGFFFAKYFLQPGRDSLFDSRLLNISLKLLDTGEWGIKDNCITMIISLGQKLNNYRALMLMALNDKDARVRQKALYAYHTFARRKELAPLEPFENDDYVTEVGMGSHLIYELRNKALETIEQTIGKKFNKHEKTEVYNGKNVVFWWDWEPFHKWKNSFWRKLQP